MLINPSRFSQNIIAVLILGISFEFFCGSAWAEDLYRLTRAEFIESLAQEQPNNPLIPKRSSALSPTALYAKTNLLLQRHGIRALAGKSGNKPITDQEFIRIAYAFSGGQKGKDLIEKKLSEKGRIHFTFRHRSINRNSRNSISNSQRRGPVQSCADNIVIVYERPNSNGTQIESHFHSRRQEHTYFE